MSVIKKTDLKRLIRKQLLEQKNQKQTELDKKSNQVLKNYNVKLSDAESGILNKISHLVLLCLKSDCLL